MSSQQQTARAPEKDRDWGALSDGLRGFIARRVDQSHIDDVLQDALEKIQKGMAKLRNEERFAPWAYRVARHAIIDHHRRRKPLQPYDEDETASLEAEQDDDNLNAEVAAWLGSILRALPERDRQALELVEIEGLSQVELAARLELSVSGAKTRVQRARRRLRDVLERCCHVVRDRRGNVLDYQPRACGSEAPCCD